MSNVKRYYIGRNRDHEKVMTEITDNDKRFIKIPDDEWVRAIDYDNLAYARANLAWVIEGGWTSIDKPDYWLGSSAWSQDPLRALRFARRQDAQQAADLMLSGVNVRICEHAWEPLRRVLVCGVDCHPGDANCNNYCNRAPQKGPMAAYPPKGPDA
jgi:hypothetical protein